MMVVGFYGCVWRNVGIGRVGTEKAKQGVSDTIHLVVSNVEQS